MSRIGNLHVSVLLFMFLCTVSIPETASSQEGHGRLSQLLQTVQDVLAGKNVEQTTTVVGRGARLVCGARFEDLKGVVAGAIKSCTLTDTSYHGVMIQAQTNPSEDAGFLILKTRTLDETNVRFHTVMFMKDSTGQYKIQSWHAGDCNEK